MIVYGSSLSPFVLKVIVAASEKAMPLELEQVALHDMNPLFREASPFGKMPGFRDGDFAVSDSSAIVTYLEAVQPDPALVPADAKHRARTIWFDEFADTILAEQTLKIFFNRFVGPKVLGIGGDLAIAEKARTEALPPLFDYLESVAPEASGFLVGDRLTLADIAVGCQFVTLAHMGIEPSAEIHPRLSGYVAAQTTRPSYTARTVRDRDILNAM